MASNDAYKCRACKDVVRACPLELQPADPAETWQQELQAQAHHPGSRGHRRSFDRITSLRGMTCVIHGNKTHKSKFTASRGRDILIRLCRVSMRFPDSLLPTSHFLPLLPPHLHLSLACPAPGWEVGGWEAGKLSRHDGGCHRPIP